MKIKNIQFELFRESSIKPRHLMWVDSEGQSDNPQDDSAENNLTVEELVRRYQIGQGTEVQRVLKKNKTLSDTDRLSYFNTWKAERTKEDGANTKDQKKTEVLEIIKNLRRKRADNQVVLDATDQIKDSYITSMEEVKEFVRNELKDLGLNKYFKDSDDETVKELLEFESDILKRIYNVIDDQRLVGVMRNIGRDKEKAENCVRIAGNFFGDEKKIRFLKFLRDKKIPAATKWNINTLISLNNKMQDNWNIKTFQSVTDANELFLLEGALKTLNKLYDAWDNSPDEKPEQMRLHLNQQKRNLNKITHELEENPNKIEELYALAKEWPQLHSNQENDINQIKKLIENTSTPSDRKLVSAFLKGSEEETKERLKYIEKIKETAAKVETKDEPPETTGTKADGEAKPIPYEKRESMEEGDHAGALAKLGKEAKKIFTANGRITWYSFHNIADSFKLIGESWTKHIESLSADKSGTLAKGLMFWRQEIQRRIHEQDLIAEQGRADERKKRYKNFSYDRLIGELSDMPAKDKRRCILETLAERGYLRMSDRELIKIICPGRFTAEDWKEADKEIDYGPMREAFKKNIDLHFIGETNYATELLDKQTSGFGSMDDAGQKIVSSTEAGSTPFEIFMMNDQTERAGMEGDAKISGLVTTLAGRANTYSNNSDFANMDIRIDGQNATINCNADMGLIGLKIIDGFMKGLIKRETMAKIGKSNESGFNPFSCFNDVIAKKTETDENEQPCSKFHKWGWVNEHDGTITGLGAVELIKFFNTRNATDIEGKLRRLTLDSFTALRHSRKLNNIRDATSQKITVGDKLTSYLVKGANVDLFDNATTEMSGGTGGMVGEFDQIASLFKAGVEDFIDGAEMEKNERYYDKFSGEEFDLKEEKDRIAMEKCRETGRLGIYGKERRERGKKILVTMMNNLWTHSEDRQLVTTKNTQFSYIEKGEDGLAKKGTGKGQLALGQFLKLSLQDWRGQDDYEEIMKAFLRYSTQKNPALDYEVKQAKAEKKLVREAV